MALFYQFSKFENPKYAICSELNPEYYKLSFVMMTLL